MVYQVDQRIFFTNNTNGKIYTCKVIEVNEDKEKIKVHFINWGKKYEEFLPINPDSIYNEEQLSDAEESFQDAEEGPIGLAMVLGKTLRIM